MKDIQKTLNSSKTFLRPFEQLIAVRDAVLEEIGERDQIDSLQADIKKIAAERDALKAELAPITAELKSATADIKTAQQDASAIRSAAEEEAKQIHADTKKSCELMHVEAEDYVASERNKAISDSQNIMASNVEKRKELASLIADIQSANTTLATINSQVAEAKAKYKELTDLLERI